MSGSASGAWEGNPRAPAIIAPRERGRLPRTETDCEKQSASVSEWAVAKRGLCGSVQGIARMKVELKVNGTHMRADVDDDTPLLWVLRDALKLKGTKYGCGIGQCGACTVIADGEATRSCSLAATAAVGLDITTVEGFSPDGGHFVQRAWQDLCVPQCGYCQSGIVRRQNIWHRSRRRLAECGPRLGFDVRRRSCGAASADIRWSVA